MKLIIIVYEQNMVCRPVRPKRKTHRKKKVMVIMKLNRGHICMFVLFFNYYMEYMGEKKLNDGIKENNELLMKTGNMHDI